MNTDIMSEGRNRTCYVGSIELSFVTDSSKIVTMMCGLRKELYCRYVIFLHK
jgi:hypothetical protein